MKLMYVVMLFLIFFNLFSFMSIGLEIFPYEYGTDYENFDINVTADTVPGQDTFKDLTGLDPLDVFGIFFGDISEGANLLITVAAFGVAVAAAWLTHSTAPLVVAFLGNLIRVTFTKSYSTFYQFEIDPYIQLAFGLGILFLLVITAAEYLTHGDA